MLQQLTNLLKTKLNIQEITNRSTKTNVKNIHNNSKFNAFAISTTFSLVDNSTNSILSIQLRTTRR
jgi:hypothetical protein